MATVRKRVSDLDEAAEITPDDYMLVMDAPSAGGTTKRVTAATVARFLKTSNTLDGLDDVDTSGVQSGDVLAFSGIETKWRPTVIDGGNF